MISMQLARAVLRTLPDHGRGPAADFAGRRLALAELAHVGDGGGRGLHGFGAPICGSLSDSGVFPWATARAQARARMSCEAEKTSRDPGRLFWFCCGLARRFAPDYQPSINRKCLH
jgi:hypothetical protein